MRKIRTLAMAAFVAALGSSPLWAQQTGHAEGEIRRVNVDDNKVTIRHGPITGGIDMPAMTMVFRAKDPAMLKGLAPGQKVRFTVADEQGALVLQSVEPAK